MAGPAVGRECKLYLNAGSYASPSLTEITHAIDVSLPFSKSYGDISSRASAWRKQKPALRELGPLTFGYRHIVVTADTVFDTLRAAAIADTTTEMFVLDGGSATQSVEGFRGFFDLAFDIDQPMEDGMMTPFTATFVGYDAGTSRDPEWYTVP